MKGSTADPTENKRAWIRMVVWIILDYLTGVQCLSYMLDVNRALGHALDRMHTKNEWLTHGRVLSSWPGPQTRKAAG